MMRSPARAAAWVAIAGFALMAAPADAEQRIPLDRRGHQEQRWDHGRQRHDAAEAAAGFLGLFLGLLGGLPDRSQAQPGCDPGAFYGWAQMRHPAYGYGFSYPSHWQQPQVNEPNIVQAVVNPCPPNAAIIIARSDVNRVLSQQELEAVMGAFQKEGGVFAAMRSQEPVPAPGQTRRKGLFSGSDGGVEMAALVHLVSIPTGLFLVVGIVPDAAGEKTGTMLRYSIESFVPAQAFAPGG
jgi:hypothetical protein